MVHRHHAVHIGIATQTANGLIVPVVKHAEARDVWDSALEVARVSSAARENKAGKDDLSGSTITVTSLGTLGGVATTPVINYPEVAIIGPNAIIERPVVRDGAIVIRKMMNLSSSFDHRVVDDATVRRGVHPKDQGAAGTPGDVVYGLSFSPLVMAPAKRDRRAAARARFGRTQASKRRDDGTIGARSADINLFGSTWVAALPLAILAP